jgi:ATP-binding protein involved in chromosome partitioning
MSSIKKMIGVASGKGGVGKSMVAINLALALSKQGQTVGLLDADIYGPSQPLMLNAVGERPVLGEGGLQPIIRYGLKTMSMGYLIDATTPMVWRGPMIGKALQQLLSETAWGDVDVLVIDLPPGTGDVQLTLCQKLSVNGIVMVTTPQEVALSDVRRACEMFRKLNVPILGLVENMSTYHCPTCQHAAPLFGEGGGARLAVEYSIPLLGSIPLDPSLREMTDKGQPPHIAAPDSVQAKWFDEIAAQLA